MIIVTLKYCTLRSSAPDCTEELTRHNGSPDESEKPTKEEAEKTAKKSATNWRAGQGTLVTRRVSPTFELRTLYANLSDVGGGTRVVLPDFGVNAQVRHLEDQEGLLLLLLQGQQHLEEEQGIVRPGLAACLRGMNFLPPGFQS